MDKAERTRRLQIVPRCLLAEQPEGDLFVDRSHLGWPEGYWPRSFYDDAGRFYVRAKLEVRGGSYRETADLDAPRIIIFNR